MLFLPLLHLPLISGFGHLQSHWLIVHAWGVEAINLNRRYVKCGNETRADFIKLGREKPAETIQGQKLFKGGIHSRKYGVYSPNVERSGQICNPVATEWVSSGGMLDPFYVVQDKRTVFDLLREKHPPPSETVRMPVFPVRIYHPWLAWILSELMWRKLQEWFVKELVQVVQMLFSGRDFLCIMGHTVIS